VTLYHIPKNIFKFTTTFIDCNYRNYYASDECYNYLINKSEITYLHEKPVDVKISKAETTFSNSYLAGSEYPLWPEDRLYEELGMTVDEENIFATAYLTAIVGTMLPTTTQYIKTITGADGSMFYDIFGMDVYGEIQVILDNKIQSKTFLATVAYSCLYSNRDVNYLICSISNPDGDLLLSEVIFFCKDKSIADDINSKCE
jgi:hypothetical protein